jgi:hypothetical protein
MLIYLLNYVVVPQLMNTLQTVFHAFQNSPCNISNQRLMFRQQVSLI